MMERDESIISGTVHGAASSVKALQERIEKAGRVLAGLEIPCPTCEANILRILELEELVRQSGERRRG